MKLIELDMSDPNRLKEKLNAMSGPELAEMLGELSTLGKAIELVGMYIVGRLASIGAGGSLDSKADPDFEKLFKGKVPEA